MKCSKVKRFISPYADGELTGKQRELFEFHLNTCRSCRLELQEIQKLHRICISSEKYAAPDGFDTMVMAGITEKESGRFAIPSLFLRIGEISIVLATIGIGVISGSILSKPFSHESATSRNACQAIQKLQSDFSLNIFEPAPPDSLGGAFLTMMEAENER